MENGNAPATRQDIQRLDQKIDQLIEQVRSEMSHQHDDLVERFTDAETRLLKAFYGFVESNQKRMLEV